MIYVQMNEHSDRAKFVHGAKDPSDVPPNLAAHLRFLDEAYPEIDIEFEVIEGEFSAELIHTLSEKWDVPTNLMFLGSPTSQEGFKLAELGGVRLII